RRRRVRGHGPGRDARPAGRRRRSRRHQLDPGPRHDRRRNGAVAARRASRVTIRVVLGEDNLLTREGITGVLDRHEDIDVVAACDNLDDLRTEIDRATPDVVLTDIRMPPTNTDEGIRLATELRTRHPAVGVVVLSQHGELVYALELFARGTNRRAYLLKDRIRDRAELAQ